VSLTFRVFEYTILGFILLNSFSMAFYDYAGKPELKGLNRKIDLLGEISTYVFTFEALVKIMAHGFVISKYSYLRDLWNILDLTIVLTGYASSNLLAFLSSCLAQFNRSTSGQFEPCGSSDPSKPLSPSRACESWCRLSFSRFLTF